MTNHTCSQWVSEAIARFIVLEEKPKLPAPLSPHMKYLHIHTYLHIYTCICIMKNHTCSQWVSETMARLSLSFRKSPNCLRPSSGRMMARIASADGSSQRTRSNVSIGLSRMLSLSSTYAQSIKGLGLGLTLYTYIYIFIYIYIYRRVEPAHTQQSLHRIEPNVVAVLNLKGLGLGLTLYICIYIYI